MMMAGAVGEIVKTALVVEKTTTRRWGLGIDHREVDFKGIPRLDWNAVPSTVLRVDANHVLIQEYQGVVGGNVKCGREVKISELMHSSSWFVVTPSRYEAKTLSQCLFFNFNLDTAMQWLKHSVPFGEKDLIEIRLET